jgi:hypothetical protein
MMGLILSISTFALGLRLPEEQSTGRIIPGDRIGPVPTESAPISLAKKNRRPV